MKQLDDILGSIGNQVCIWRNGLLLDVALAKFKFSALIL